jgi:amino acid adenylation domain-containing protein
VVWADGVLSYRELDERANRLAQYLQSLGVGPEVLVGVCVERSPEMMVSLLGVLKAGGAYVPLDPGFPVERLRFMLADAAAPVVLTQSRLRDRLPESAAMVVCVDEDWPTVAAFPDENPESRTTPENLAYVIYTSGSTGVPKGVMVEHAGLVNYLEFCVKCYVGEATDWGAPVFSSIGFDAVVPDLYTPLLVGQPVVLLSEDWSASELLDLLGDGDRRFSFIKLTPAHLDLLATELAGALDRLTDTLVVGAEALWSSQLAPWLEQAPDTRLLNEYGPTEASVANCLYPIPPEGVAEEAVPIGRPIPNTQMFVLDEWRRPVPVGVPGEIYIGGVAVARGYLNRPELTAERFVESPFVSGGRLYRTGDLGRFRADGNIEFLGRRDDQVKVRGFRVELGEVEAVLSEHPGVRSAAVMARADDGGERRLVAYVVAAGAEAPSVGELRGFLAERLPTYMIPAQWVMLDELPLTPHGKLDRKALPAPDGSRPELEVAYVAPRSLEEQVLAEIWAEVLGVERVGVHDNFFELGGHSLVATQIVSRAKELLSIELSIKDLFTNPTIERISALGLNKKTGASAPIRRSSRRRYALQPTDPARLVSLREPDLDPDSDRYHDG